MTATANIIYNVKPNALLVKKSSLVEEDRKSYVWKIERGTLKKQLVQTGESDIAFVEIVQGIKNGDTIALAPEKSFREGFEVNKVSKVTAKQP
jgi:hypothetical protein